MSVKFGPEVRLRSRREFSAVQEQGRRLATPYLTLLARPNSLASDRLGIVASRRVGGAVVRNLIKRRFREIFRAGHPDLAASRGSRCLDFVVIARSQAAGATFQVLRDDFVTALERLGQRVRP